MRRHYKNIISDIIETLNEATVEIQRMFFDKNIPTLNILLSACAESIIQVCDIINQTTDEGTKTVVCLKEYLNTLNRFHTEPGNGPELVNELKKQIIKIKNTVEIDLKVDRLEMVFLPYKASMFDSMESVWLAASKDPQCDAYVIPIPYYEKNANDSGAKLIYEGSLYPDYVPIIDWRNYDFEAHRPDVIVIHNPFDEDNLVTSVPVNFFSKKLKEFTDLLVYIPYFVYGNNLSHINNHCANFGIKYADVSILQSDEVCSKYREELRKFEMENNCKGLFGNMEKKLVALGSPKFDKVINTAREDCPLPDEWKHIVAGKRIVLYNTTLYNMLKLGDDVDKWFDKLTSVFEIFRNRDDAILWWRPHPLLKATLASMRPLLLDRYNEIVEQFMNDGLGIFDDTADLHMAITWSDLYYGDGGSLLSLYEATGKPIMLQNTKIPSKADESCNLAFENLYDDGIHLWFTAWHFNGLFQLNKETWEAEFMGVFPGEEFYCKRLYGQIAENNGKLYFAPFNAKEIGIYDIKTKQFDKVTFTKPNNNNIPIDNFQSKCFGIATKNEYVFFIGVYNPAIIRYNTLNHELCYFNGWIADIDKLKNAEDVYFMNHCIFENKIIACTRNANAVLVFDMDCCSYAVYEVGNKEANYSGICFDGIYFWLSPRRNGPIVRWDFSSNKYIEISALPSGFLTSDTLSFRDIIYANSRLWLLSFSANMSLTLSTNDYNLEIAVEFQDVCMQKETSLFKGNYIMAKVIDNVVYAHTGKTNRLISYNSTTKERCENAIRLSPESRRLLLDAYISKIISEANASSNCHIHENTYIRLPDLIEYTFSENFTMTQENLRKKQENFFSCLTKNANGTSGDIIFSYLKSKIY